MKTLMIASTLAMTAFAMPAFAGPSVGSTSFHTGTFGARPPMPMTKTAAPYALTGRIDQDREREYRWRVETRQMGRQVRTFYVREVVR